MHKLYKLIDDNKLTSPERILDFFTRDDLNYICEFIMEAYVISNSPDDIDVKPSIFNFSASLSLSGGRYPCPNLRCRLKRIQELIYFASFYSDSVVIFNPFEIFYAFFNEEIKTEYQEKEIREEAIFVFSALLILRPLIESHLVIISHSVFFMCSYHMKEWKKSENELYDTLYRKLKETIYPKIRKDVKIVTQSPNVIVYYGLEKYIGEDMTLTFTKYYPKKKIPVGTNLPENYSKFESSHMPIAASLFDSIDSVIMQKLKVLNKHSTTYLSNNYLDKMLLESLQKNYMDSKPFELVTKHLPTVVNVDPYTLIDLRHSNQQVFANFRNYLSELFSQSSKFDTQQEYNSFINNALQDGVDEIKSLYKSKKSQYIKTSSQDAMLSVASIILSLETNSTLPLILDSLKIFHDCRKMHSEYKNMLSEIQNRPMYFYYKLKDTSPKLYL